MIIWKILWFLFWLGVFGWIIYNVKFFRTPYLKTKEIFLLFLIKVLASFAVYVVYDFHYKNRLDADIFKYYDDGQILYNSFYKNPTDFFKMISGIGQDEPQLQPYYQQMNFWIKPYQFEIINENKTIIRINALLRFISFDNYFIHSLFFVFLSFIGLFAIFKVLSEYTKINHKLLAFVIFLLPSTLFWSSAILKESVVFLNLGLGIYFFNQWYHSNKASSIIYSFIFCVLLMFSKFYIFLLITPALCFIVLHKLFPHWKKVFLFSITHLIFILFFFYSEYLIPYNFSEIVTIKQHNFINMTHVFKVGSVIDIPILDDSLFSFVKNTPNALINTLFRPFIWEFHNFLAFLSALENLLIFLLLVVLLLFHKPAPDNIWMWFSLSFAILLFILIGLSTPVLGALVRYKVPGLPFFIYLVLQFIDFEKIKKTIGIWKKPF